MLIIEIVNKNYKVLSTMVGTNALLNNKDFVNSMDKIEYNYLILFELVANLLWDIVILIIDTIVKIASFFLHV